MTDPLTAILDAGAASWWEIKGRHCLIFLEPRPAHCNRGNWIAKLDAAPVVDIDHQDGWPRYYFDRDRAMAEIEAWLIKRGQAIGSAWTHEYDVDALVAAADQRAKEDWERMANKPAQSMSGIIWMPRDAP